MSRKYAYFILILLNAMSLLLHSQIDVLADDSFVFTKDGSDIALPYYSTHDIFSANDDISQIIIVVHGTNRNADDYFANMKSALNQRPALIEKTVIVAPQFLREDDIDAFTPGNDFSYWSSDGWKVGSTSKNEPAHPRSIRISSYEILDSLIIQLISNFSNTQQLVFTGHSAGGQLTNRYTASSPIFSLLCEDYGVSSKSVIANPGSYVYFSPRRRVLGSIDQFEIPNGCSEYDEYSYGLNDLYIYHERSGAEQMKEWYGTREIIYLNGERDNNPNASTLPSSCRAQLQGAHRLEKGLIYYNHMIDTYGTDINQTQKMLTIPNVGHNNFDMYTSDIGLKVLFDEVPLAQCGQTTSTTDINDYRPIIYPNPTTGLIQLRHSIEDNADKMIYITDYLGNVLLTSDTKTAQGMNLSGFEKGIYFLQIEYQGRKSTQKITKL